MRILIVDNKVCDALSSQLFTKLAEFGSVDIVQNGRDAVLAYVKSSYKGFFYDFVVLEQDLALQDGFETHDMIRAFESEHRTSGKKTTVCVLCSDTVCQQQHHGARYDNNLQTHLLAKPVNLDLLHSLAVSAANGYEFKSRINLIPRYMKQPVSIHA